MAKKVQRAVRLEKWMIESIAKLAEDKKTTFSDMVNMLLESELNYLGESQAKYNAEAYGIGREPASSTQELKSEAKVKKTAS